MVNDNSFSPREFQTLGWQQGGVRLSFCSTITLASSALYYVNAETFVIPPLEWTQERQDEIKAAAASCAVEGKVASGHDFAECVDSAVSPVTSRKWLTEYHETIRNFTCARNDAGTPPKFTMNFTLEFGYAACPSYSPVAAKRPPTEIEVHPDFSYLPGFLPAGNDIPSPDGEMTAQEAAAYCSSVEFCNGFTFRSMSPTGPAAVFFKTSLKGFRFDPAGQDPEPWHLYRRKRPETCSSQPRKSRRMFGEAQNFTVDVIREKPLVAVVRAFALDSECNDLVDRGGDWALMERATLASGNISTYRHSYATNVTANLSDPADSVTSIVSRMFAVTRRLTGLSVYPPGQESLNAVLYRDIGDEYRPHCDDDGNCHAGMYEKGTRIATTLIYCRVPELGGATTFTNDALKIVPKSGDMLLFSYLLTDELMAGKDGEHSGCPVQKGQKWVGTQWYREGVDSVWTWEDQIRYRPDLLQ